MPKDEGKRKKDKGRRTKKDAGKKEKTFRKMVIETI